MSAERGLRTVASNNATICSHRGRMSNVERASDRASTCRDWWRAHRFYLRRTRKRLQRIGLAAPQVLGLVKPSAAAYWSRCTAWKLLATTSRHLEWTEVFGVHRILRNRIFEQTLLHVGRNVTPRSTSHSFATRSLRRKYLAWQE